MSEPEWSAQKQEQPAAEAMSSKDTNADPARGISRRSTWVIFAWVVLAYWLMMWCIWAMELGVLLVCYNSMQVNLPRTTRMTFLLLEQAWPFYGVMLMVPTCWGALIHWLPSDRARKIVSGFFCAFLLCIPAAILLAAIGPMITVQEILRTG